MTLCGSWSKLCLQYSSLDPVVSQRIRAKFRLKFLVPLGSHVCHWAASWVHRYNGFEGRACYE